MHQAVRFIPRLYHLRHFHPFREARDVRNGTERIAKYPNYQLACTSVSFSRKCIFSTESIADLTRCVTVFLHLWHLIFRRTSNNARLSRPRGQSWHVRGKILLNHTRPSANYRETKCISPSVVSHDSQKLRILRIPTFASNYFLFIHSRFSTSYESRFNLQFRILDISLFLWWFYH